MRNPYCLLVLALLSTVRLSAQEPFILNGTHVIETSDSVVLLFASTGGYTAATIHIDSIDGGACLIRQKRVVYCKQGFYARNDRIFDLTYSVAVFFESPSLDSLVRYVASTCATPSEDSDRPMPRSELRKARLHDFQEVQALCLMRRLANLFDLVVGDDYKLYSRQTKPVRLSAEKTSLD